MYAKCLDKVDTLYINFTIHLSRKKIYTRAKTLLITSYIVDRRS